MQAWQSHNQGMACNSASQQQVNLHANHLLWSLSLDSPTGLAVLSGVDEEQGRQSPGSA